MKVRVRLEHEGVHELVACTRCGKLSERWAQSNDLWRAFPDPERGAWTFVGRDGLRATAQVPDSQGVSSSWVLRHRSSVQRPSEATHRPPLVYLRKRSALPAEARRQRAARGQVQVLSGQPKQGSALQHAFHASIARILSSPAFQAATGYNLHAVWRAAAVALDITGPSPTGVDRVPVLFAEPTQLETGRYARAKPAAAWLMKADCQLPLGYRVCLGCRVSRPGTERGI